MNMLMEELRPLMRGYANLPPVPPPAPPSPPLKLWHQVLREAGYPTNVLLIDFETFYSDDYGLKKLSTIEYVMDRRFEVLSCAITYMTAEASVDGYPYCTEFFVGEDDVRASLNRLQQLDHADLRTMTVVAQNLAFDATILSRRFGIHPKFVVDILGLARHQNARRRNDLGSLCKTYGLPPKGDTADFKDLSLRQRFRLPRRGPKIPQPVPAATKEQLAALEAYNRNDALREWELFTLLLPKLSNPAIELRLMQHTIELFTKPTLRADFEKGADLIRRMETRIEEAMPEGIGRKEISGTNSFAALLTTAIEQAGENPLQYTKFGKRGAVLALAKADVEREELLKHPDPKVRGLMEARAAIKSWPLHVARVQNLMDQARVDGGRLPVALKYHGAHTGRASGGEAINLQNLGSRGDPLISEVREMIVAPEGHELVIVDAGAIEARVLAWVAGQWDLVEKFKNGEEIYCGFASKVLGWSVRKPRREGGIPAIESRMAWARNSVGKIGILGCGYGMGARNSKDKSQPNHMFASAGIEVELADKIVQTYRQEHPQIAAFWREIERKFRYAAGNYGRDGSLERGLRFSSVPDCDVVITLPNGRELHYPQVRSDIQHGLEIYNSFKKCWEYSWGGTLTENVVQAMARDILFEAMLRLETAGYHTALHCHDELVLVVPKGAGKSCLDLAIKELSREPVWASGMALAAEGAISERYCKH